jgi:ubiquinone/menaquinone biosynthesis C-methylase UbiE
LKRNLDAPVIEGFGKEWAKFDQTALRDEEFKRTFDSYFRVFPWHLLPRDAVGFDLGCGTGRWARGVASRVQTLHCIDPSAEALAVARRNLAGEPAVRFHLASVDDLPLDDASMDFGYCLGVLHHVPDTAAGLRSAAAKLKRGAPFLVYLYYAFDNKPVWYKLLHRATEALRWTLSRAPFPLRYAASQVIAALVYWPLARLAKVLERAGMNVASLPLSFYREHSFYTMRTDALDRFGTRLEQRFTRAQIRSMMEDAGLENVVFSDALPYWCAVGVRR